MSRRLQVLFDEEELAEIPQVARSQRTTVAEWVRRSLRAARRDEPFRKAHRKLEAVRLAAQHDFPTGEVKDLLADIERGYGVTPE